MLYCKNSFVDFLNMVEADTGKWLIPEENRDYVLILMYKTYCEVLNELYNISK